MRVFRLLDGTKFLCRCDDERIAAQIAKTYSHAYNTVVTVEEYVPLFQYENGEKRDGEWIAKIFNDAIPAVIKRRREELRKQREEDRLTRGGAWY